MIVNFIDSKDKTLYENFVNDKEETTCLQMWEWATFRNKLGSKLYNRIGIVNNGKLSLSAIYAVNKFSFLGNVLYIPQGPIWDGNKSLFEFKKSIVELAEVNNCFAVICDPRVEENGKKFNELLESGFKCTHEAVQPRVTIRLELSRSEEDLLASFNKSTRYNIKYANKNNIKITKYNSPSDIDHIKTFYKLITETKERKYFYVQQEDYFSYLWSEFSGNKHATIYEASFKDEILGSMIVINNDHNAFSLFSASTRKYDNLKFMYLLRWESIKDAKNRGCKVYDFFGATDESNTHHPFYYTTQHKLGFSKNFVKYAGTFEILLNPIKYNIWKLFQKAGIIKFYEKYYLVDFKKRNVN